MDEKFIRDRITELRMKKGVSEYKMSYDLGKSRGYIYNISSGKSLPPMKEFLSICDYLEVTPQQFFDSNTKHPELVQKGKRRKWSLNFSQNPFSFSFSFPIIHILVLFLTV